ncbi:L-seryl-tRNA(Sec) selenium transferase [bacterium]|nr:L-seryl-tRNA(Sec) selenium transferase [candidate division CSSED10-310 bacterium]
MKYRDIPPIHRLLDDPHFASLTECHTRNQVKLALREIMDVIRSGKKTLNPADIEPANLAQQVEIRLQIKKQSSLRKLINATGTILHTNLGRAPLAREAIEAVGRISTGYSNLELDLGTGKRGRRSDHVGELLRELTGCEAAAVVNNNAGAVLLVLSALAQDREVIVSRGELIEIGGNFRMPDVMKMSGCRLKEVGTTNRTHLSDYAHAINETTALLMKAHFSNFQMVGFTREVLLPELVSLGRSHSIPVVFDLGSGCMVDGPRMGRDAPRVDQCIAEGTDIVSFSGDKLLGGPQAGIIIGRRELIGRIADHPLARALRIDKMTLAALEATLSLYRDPHTAWSRIPTLRMLAEPDTEIRKRARSAARRIQRLNLPNLKLTVKPDTAPVGGGALPLLEMPTSVIEIETDLKSPQTLMEAFRNQSPPVICRISKDHVCLDFRTVENTELGAIARAFQSVFSR